MRGPTTSRSRPVLRLKRASQPLASGALALSLLMAVGSPISAQGRYQVARSTEGMVTTAHPLATVAGAEILAMGGNAADAAVTAAFAVAVVRPSMNSIGGRNQILIRSADGQFHGIDGTTQVPLNYDAETAPRASFGHGTVGVPGALAGLMRLHAEHGSLPLETVMGPAINYAENGFRLLRGQSGFHLSTKEALAQTEGGRMYYLRPDASPHREGELFVQTDLGQTLRRLITGGHDLFYKGEMAQIMAADMKANGGFVDLESLAQYEAETSRIVRGSYRGYELIGTDVPASGAVSILALQIMENFDRDSLDDDEWAAVIGQAVGLASPERDLLGTDEAAERVTSKAYAAEQAANVRVAATTDAAGLDAVEFPTWWEADHHTTHLSTADPSGMAVALTQTNGPAFGSKVAVPGLGFLYASTLGGYLSGDQSPGFRARSSISPLMVQKDGELMLVLGSAGGARIVSSVVQAVSRVVDDGMSLAEALAAARVHPNDDGLDMEMSAGWTEDDLADIRALGLDVEETLRVGAFGRVQAIRFYPETGEWVGVSDPDSEGTARGPVLTPGRWP